jgi:sortase (surface protein transpeptidase)
MAGFRLKGRQRGGLRRQFNAGTLTFALVAAAVARVHAHLGTRRGPRSHTPTLVSQGDVAPVGVCWAEAPAALPGPAPLAVVSLRRWRRGLTRAVAAGLLMVLVTAVVMAPAVATDDESNDLLALTPPTAGRPTPQPSSAVMTPPGRADVDLSGGPSHLDGFAVAPATPDLDLSASPTAAPSSVGVPTRIDIPSIGVHAFIVPLGLGPGGVIEVPDNFVQAGWYSGGPRPGDSGPAVILGHVDSFSGPAVFFELKDLQAGATIMVTSSTGTQAFVVDSVEKYAKTDFPTEAVYGPVSDRALRLVTCGGQFDETKHSYLSNVIVFATAAS